MNLSRRAFLFLLGLTGCSAGSRSHQGQQLVIGAVSYGAGQDVLARYDGLKRYLEAQMQAIAQLEPAYNEAKALERISARAWSLVFSPPGLAAIAITQHQYKPIFSLEDNTNSRSVIVVKQDSPHTDLKSLTGQPFAIGQPGSATSYYFPIFNLYGLTLSEFMVTPTPLAVLEAISQGKAAAGALSLGEFNRLRTQIPATEFRILYSDPHPVPPGVILLSPDIEASVQDSINRTLASTPLSVAQESGFLPTGTVPDYQYMISVVKRVQSIFPADSVAGNAALITQKPVRLF